MTDFAQAFQNDQNNISDAVNEIGPLVSQVIPSHSVKSHDFFDEHGGIYSINVFPSLCMHIFLLPDKKFILLNCVHTFYAHF